MLDVSSAGDVPASRSDTASLKALFRLYPPDGRGTLLSSAPHPEFAMPLLDHFHAPLKKHHSWESFHSGWALSIARQLNKRPLPPGFLAEHQVTVGVAVEADVATFEKDREEEESSAFLAAAGWVPPRAVVATPVDLAGIDVFEVKVYDEDRARTLVAAVELVSPANKDRASHRRAFVAKCAAYLQENVSVIIVDVVTTRHHHLYRELAEFLDLNQAARNAVPVNLYAVALRAIRPRRGKMRLEVWPAQLALGTALPTLPLWLGPDIAVALDLEASYEFACDSLSIPA
jgi:hypothetical protein